MNGVPAFDRYVGIDYSGAQTPSSSLKGLRVYRADRISRPSKCSLLKDHENIGRAGASRSG